MRATLAGVAAAKTERAKMERVIADANILDIMRDAEDVDVEVPEGWNSATIYAFVVNASTERASNLYHGEFVLQKDRLRTTSTCSDFAEPAVVM